MGRKKGYEREELISSAFNVFHRLGYQGSTTEVLVRELGVNRNSVYSEFGSKEGLFSDALLHYDNLMVSQVFGPLEKPSATLVEVEELFHLFASSAVPLAGLGCLMCNTIAELGDTNSGLTPFISDYYERLQRAFSNALHGAIRVGQIPSDVDVDAEARFLTACCHGISLMVRSGIHESAPQQAVKGALRHLNYLQDARPKNI